MNKLLRPRLIVPGVLSIAIVAALLAFGNLKAMVALILSFPHLYLLWFFLLMVLYEAIRGLQWHRLLRALDVRAPVRAQAFAFVLSEFARNLPIGSYFQNYLLQASSGADFGRTSAATTVILVTEIAFCLGGVMILGLGSWSPLLRPILGGGLVVVLLVTWVLLHLHRSPRAPRWVRTHKHLRRIAEEVRRFREGAATLDRPKILIEQALLGAIYLLIATAGLHVILRGLDPQGAAIGFTQTLAVYLFTLLSALILPVPEAGGVGALLAFGISRDVAITAMLLNRVLSVIAAIVIATLVTMMMPDQWRAVLHMRRETPRRQEGGAHERGDVVR
ncbi:MAG TPA: lysylphosphatidylglycerol synthase transmembrane domain-containing protein [Chloroflexota bacterium]|nr:lysylphosphatidylglycerol synthase transmembrane domain-containing protein [Chloroflexota bacterium]